MAINPIIYISMDPKRVANAFKRLNRDLKELEKSPVEGAAICPVNDQMFEMHGNLIIPEGPYMGLLIHFIINIPAAYPLSSPAGSIAPGYPFNDRHHEHIHGHGLCNNYLSNYENFFKGDNGQIAAGSGWSPAMDLKALLMVLKQFFADIDMANPEKAKVVEVFDKVATYKCPGCTHTTDKPNPPLPVIDESSGQVDASYDDNDKQVSQAVARAKNILVCSFSKENYCDNSNLILGYPIELSRDKYQRMWTNLVPELISYDQYALAIQAGGSTNLDKVKFRTASGQLYNYWLPIYINEDHYTKNLQHIKNTISVVANGIKGKSENDFVPEFVLRVLPSLMNKMVVALMNGQTFASENCIIAYVYYLRLLIRFIQEYPKLDNLIDNEIGNFVANARFRNKKVVPDIGEFFVKLSVSKKYTYDKVKQFLVNEYFARQVMWIEKANIKDLYTKPIGQRLSETFKATEVSNKLFVFNLMMAKYFVFDGMESKLDNNFGLAPDFVIQNFQQLIKNIKSINDYTTLMKAISYTDIKDDAGVIGLLDTARKISRAQAYTK